MLVVYGNSSISLGVQSVLFYTTFWELFMSARALNRGNGILSPAYDLREVLRP